MTKYSKPRLTVRPALRLTDAAVCRALTALGIMTGREIAPGVIEWWWSDGR